MSGAKKPPLKPSKLLRALADIFMMFNHNGVTEYVERFETDADHWGRPVLVITDDNGYQRHWRLEYEGYEEARR